MKLKLCVLSVLFLTGLCEARMVASRIDCLSDPCFRSSLTECAGQLIIRQPARRALKIAKRRCTKQLVAQCRRTGTMPFCGDDSSNPPADPSYPYPPDDSAGGAFPSTTTTTLGRYPTTTTTLPPIASSFVGDYQFVGQLTWDECGLAYQGSYVQVAFTVEVQEGDFLLGTLGTHHYDASGEVSDLTWNFHAHQCDLYNRCCIDETVTTNTGGLPTDSTFKFHYECPEDHTHCDTEGEGLTYVMPGTHGPYQ